MRTFIVVLALLAVAAHVWFSRKLHEGPNQVILTNAVKPAVESTLEGVSIRYELLDGILEGVVQSEGQKVAAEKKAKEMIRAGRIVNHLVVKEATLPALLSADWNGKEFELRGTIATEGLRKKIEHAFFDLKMGPVKNQIKVDSKVIKPAWLGKLSLLPLEFFTQNPGQPASVSIEPNAIRLKSAFLDETWKRHVLASTESIGLTVIDEIVLVPKKSCRLVAMLAGKGLQLEGLVPNQELAQSLAKAATTTGAKVTSQITVDAHTIPPPWSESAAAFLAGFLSETPYGELDMNGDTIRLSRQVNHFEEKTAWLEKAKKVMPGAKIIDQMKFPTSSRPFEFSLNRAASTVVLKGWVPGMDLKTKILAASRAKFPGVTVKDELFAAPNVSMPDWGAALPDALKGLTSLEGISNLAFDAKGLKFPETVSVELKKQFSSIFGEKFPGGALASPPALIAAAPSTVATAPAATTPPTPVPVPVPAPVDKPPPVAKITPVPAPVGKTPPAPAPVAKTPPAPVPASRPKVEPVMAAKVEKLPPAPVVAPKPAPVPASAVTKKETPVVVPRPKPVTSLASTAVYGANTYPANLFIDYDGKKVRLTGNVPSDKTKKVMGDAVAAALAKVEISNLIHVDKRVIPPLWEDQLPAFITDFFKIRASEAELEIDQDRLRLKQQLLDDRTKVEFVARGLDMLPRGRLIDQLSTPTYDPYRIYQAPEPARENVSKYIVYFDSASYALDKSSLREIQAAVDYYKKTRSTSANILGFTDGRGNPAYNKILSEKRASAVVANMVSRGIKRSAIQYNGLGATQSWDGDVREHRRVEIVIE